MTKYNKQGEEIPDTTPVRLPLGWNRPPSLNERIARMVSQEMARLSTRNEEAESFEEANDFDIEDDPIDKQSPWEEPEDTGVLDQEIALHLAKAKQLKEQKTAVGAVSKAPKPKPKKAKPAESEEDASEGDLDNDA